MRHLRADDFGAAPGHSNSGKLINTELFWGRSHQMLRKPGDVRARPS